LGAGGRKADVGVVRSFHPEAQGADAVAGHIIEVVLLAVSSAKLYSKNKSKVKETIF